MRPFRRVETRIGNCQGPESIPPMAILDLGWHHSPLHWGKEGYVTNRYQSLPIVTNRYQSLPIVTNRHQSLLIVTNGRSSAGSAAPVLVAASSPRARRCRGRWALRPRACRRRDSRTSGLCGP
jgi:hypothetical protein